MRKAFRFLADLVVVGASQLEARDILLYGGLSLVGYGLSLIYWPAAFIAPGAVLAAVAVFGVR